MIPVFVKFDRHSKLSFGMVAQDGLNLTTTGVNGVALVTRWLGQEGWFGPTLISTSWSACPSVTTNWTACGATVSTTWTVR